MSAQLSVNVETESLIQMDVNAILERALQERETIISRSLLLREFQDDIDTAVNGSRDLTQRLEKIAVAAKYFNHKRGISTKISNLGI